MIPYENYQLNSRQIERISRMKARERIQQYIKEYGHAPSQEMISTFGAITADELEHYRRYYYSHNAEKENVGITATVEGWATQTQKVYDEFIRLTYNVTDINNLTRLFKQSNNIGFVELDGEELDLSSLNIETVSSNLGTDKYYRCRFNSIGVHTASVLLSDYGLTAISNYPFLLGSSNAIREITIPSCITYVGRMFNGCYGLETIVCFATTPPTATIRTSASNAKQRSFQGMRNNGTLFVPSQSIDAYKETWMKPEETDEETLAGHQWEIKPIPGT